MNKVKPVVSQDIVIFYVEGFTYFAFTLHNRLEEIDKLIHKNTYYIFLNINYFFLKLFSDEQDLELVILSHHFSLPFYVT